MVRAPEVDKDLFVSIPFSLYIPTEITQARLWEIQSMQKATMNEGAITTQSLPGSHEFLFQIPSSGFRSAA